MYFYIYLISFFLVAITYSLLASLTKIFYKNKSIDELSLYERDILYGRAGFVARLGVFITNFISSFIVPQVSILAGLITVIVFVINLVI